jgi:glycerate kinase
MHHAACPVCFRFQSVKTGQFAGTATAAYAMGTLRLKAGIATVAMTTDLETQMRLTTLFDVENGKIRSNTTAERYTVDFTAEVEEMVP